VNIRAVNDGQAAFFILVRSEVQLLETTVVLTSKDITVTLHKCFLGRTQPWSGASSRSWWSRPASWRLSPSCAACGSGASLSHYLLE